MMTSRLNTPPACAPVNASRSALRLNVHDSGPVWLAKPSPYGSFIRTSTPVYPGALVDHLKHPPKSDANARGVQKTPFIQTLSLPTVFSLGQNKPQRIAGIVQSVWC